MQRSQTNGLSAETIRAELSPKVTPRPYAQFQSLFDGTAAHGARNYWKAHYLQQLTSDAVDTLCAQTDRMTSKESSIGMLSLGGAVRRAPADTAPYPHRDADWVLNIQARWREPSQDTEHIAPVRADRAALHLPCQGLREGAPHEFRLPVGAGGATVDRNDPSPASQPSEAGRPRA